MKITKSILFVWVILCCYSISNGQKTGKVNVIVQDSRINTLVSKHIAFNENRVSIEGFRVQIFFDSGVNSKANANRVKSEFEDKYVNTGAYLSWQEPNFKVRVGDFRSRMDAQRFLHLIIEEYPNAFVVKDNEINYPNLEDESK